MIYHRVKNNYLSIVICNQNGHRVDKLIKKILKYLKNKKFGKRFHYVKIGLFDCNDFDYDMILQLNSLFSKKMKKCVKFHII